MVAIAVLSAHMTVGAAMFAAIDAIPGRMTPFGFGYRITAVRELPQILPITLSREPQTAASMNLIVPIGLLVRVEIIVRHFPRSLV